MASKPAESYRAMLRIRRFEERVLELFPRGLFYGTTHTYIGQEANAVGVLEWLQDDDVVVSNHRCHGHFLAYGGSMHGLAAELMGRATGICGGRGGSQHIQWRNFYANGILGGTIPLAVGMAFAAKARSESSVVFAFMGDGTLGEGVVYESLNMAALWQLPLFFVLENNRYAQSTPISLNLAGQIEARFGAFGIDARHIDSTDVEQITGESKECLVAVRDGEGPRALIIDTYRFGPHSKGDDVRDPEEVERFKEKDPLLVQKARIEAADVDRIEGEVQTEVEQAFQVAMSDPAADPAEITPAVERSR